jgi:hypothetical protein
MRGGKLIIPALFTGGIVALAGGAAQAQGIITGTPDYSASLSGFNELGTINAQTGAILSNGTGTAQLFFDRSTSTITYTLTYSNVGTTAPLTGTVTQAHIHFGKSRDSGGILVYFCTNLALPASFTGPAPPPCPKNSGTVSGSWTGANVQAIATQNVIAGDFDALVGALESNTAYANIHQTALGAGEIRGQVHANTAN